MNVLKPNSPRSQDLSTSTMAPESLLVRYIKTHVAKGDKAKDKSEQHYISAGQHLKTLKATYAPSWEAWETILKTKVKLSTGRASELMQIAEGRKPVAQIRADKAESVRQLRASKSLHYSEEESPETSAEAMKECFAAADLEETEATAATPTIFQPNLDKEEFRKVKAVADAYRHDQKQSNKDLRYQNRYAHELLTALTDSTPEIRAASVQEIVSGSRQSEFRAVIEAVRDLYQQLSKAGR